MEIIMKKIVIALFIINGLIFSSCEDWLDINRDPSFPQEAPAEVILPVMFAEMARGEFFDSRFFGSYVQNWAHTTAGRAEDVHGYFAGSDNIGEKWREHYWGIGLNIDLMVADAEANSKWWYAGVAYAIRAWSWQTSTDVYGEMILKQAFEPNRYTFDYDAQEEIYAEVVRLCNLSLTYLEMEDATNSLVKGDLVYAGDRDKWKKFVYAILARNAHHLSNKASYDADAVIGFVDKSLSSNADNFSIPFLGTTSAPDGGNSNFFGPLRANLGVYRQTTFAISLMNGTVLGGGVDPRMANMFQPSTDGVYRGLTNGAGNTFAGAQAIPGLYGKYLYRDNAPLPIFTYAEMQFIKAEAAFKKADLATALSAYQAGIQAHLDYVGSFLTGAALTNFNAAKAPYMASAAVAQNTGELTLSDIMLQKYIAMYGHGILETWVDMRRHKYDAAVYTGFTLPNPLASTNNGKPAYRARPRYNSEYVWNIKALEQIGGTNLDYHTYEPWFILP
jgi:hypothetical protein